MHYHALDIFLRAFCPKENVIELQECSRSTAVRKAEEPTAPR